MEGFLDTYLIPDDMKMKIVPTSRPYRSGQVKERKARKKNITPILKNLWINMQRAIFITYKKCARIWIEQIYQPRFDRSEAEQDAHYEGWVKNPEIRLGYNDIGLGSNFIPTARPRISNVRQQEPEFVLRDRRLPPKWKGLACPQCADLFVTYTKYLSHVTKDHPDEQMWLTSIYCYKCRYQFKSFNEAVSHKFNIHRSPEALKIVHRKLSMQEYVEPRLIPCDICDKIFFTVEDLSDHMQASHQKKRYCFRCDISFGNVQDAMCHVNEVHAEHYAMMTNYGNMEKVLKATIDPKTKGPDVKDEQVEEITPPDSASNQRNPPEMN